MKRLVLGALALAALLPVYATAQDTRVDRLTLANRFDLDGVVAAPAHIMAATAITDNGSTAAAYVLAALPDTCRLVDITVVDTNMTAGTLTVVGTGCFDEAKSCSFTFTAADDTGVKSLTCSDGRAAYLKTVSVISNGVMTGESDETVSVGFTSDSVNGWAMLGALAGPLASGAYQVNPHGSYAVPLKVTTSGSLSTTVTGVNGSDDAFARVSAGDLLELNVGGVRYERLVSAKASADSITVNQAINIPAAGVTYHFKKLFYSPNPADILAVPVSGYKSALFTWSVDANENTGGIVTLLQCTNDGPEFPAAHWTTITQTTATVASGATQADTPEAINLVTHPYAFCRFGLSFGDGDNADAAAEDINLSVALAK
jgi:hypothetical protein